MTTTPALAGSAPKQNHSDQLVFRKTNTNPGRHVYITPDNSSMRHLAYARIVLNAARPSESFSNGVRETGLICLSGEAEVNVGSQKVHLGKRDAMYIPRDSTISITSKSSADLAEFSAGVEQRYPLQVVRAAEIAKDPALHFTSGGPGCTRHIEMLLTKNIEAGRLVIGITTADPGNWTSWPPHEHAAMLEEMYLYFDMPEPGYGIQLVYTSDAAPEVATIVRDGDVVLMPSGYHPNVSVPGHSICFVWAMAAHREVQDRQWGVVNVQPGFETKT
jgi:5-deoxy-glucuronate isomerase